MRRGSALRFSIFFVQLLLHSGLEFTPEVQSAVPLQHEPHLACYKTLRCLQVIDVHFSTVPDAMFTLFQET